MDDVIECWVFNAEPCEPNSPNGYAERHIHSEIYKRHDDIYAVVHSHSEAFIPYTITGVGLKAYNHMAGFLGSDAVPVCDIAQYYEDEDGKDLLVRNKHIGNKLAEYFDGGNKVTLVRSHGFTVIAESIEEVVLRATHAQKNAAI